MRGRLSSGSALVVGALAILHSSVAGAADPLVEEAEVAPTELVTAPTEPALAEKSSAATDRLASPDDVRGEIPIVAYSYTAHGASAGSIGVAAYGLGLTAPGQRAIAGGGATVWGSPVDRLTLVGDGARDMFGNVSPSAAVIVRIAGKAGDGWSVGALGKFKIEGFGTGPNGETESEIESGLLVSCARAGWHLDANALGGMGTGDAGEVDVEGRLRLGRDLGRFARLGIDGQMRVRASGDKPLPGGRTWDFAGGPQVLVGSGHLFGALTGGPATMGVVDHVGWTAIASLGGMTL
jgi:hypothetical protein